MTYRQNSATIRKRIGTVLFSQFSGILSDLHRLQRMRKDTAAFWDLVFKADVNFLIVVMLLQVFIGSYRTQFTNIV